MIEIYNTYLYEGKKVYVLGKCITDTGRIAILYRILPNRNSEYCQATLEEKFTLTAKLLEK